MSILFDEQFERMETETLKKLGMSDEDIAPLHEFYDNLKKCLERRKQNLEWVYKQIEAEKAEKEARTNENSTGN